MENNSIFDSNYQPSNSEDLSKGVKKQQAPFSPPQITGESNEATVKTMRRENDSMDDFEHLEHESSPSEDSQADLRNILDGTSVQLIDLPHSSRGDEISDSGVLTNVASKLERNILDTSIPADEKILQPVPATPPPSANYEKHENVERDDEELEKENNKREKEDDDENDETASSRVLVESAQTLSVIVAKDYPKDQHREQENHHYHHYQIESNKMNQDKSDKHQMDSKAATMAFMETERSVGDFHHSVEQMNIPDKFQHDVDVSRSMKNQDDHILHDEKFNEKEIRDNIDETVKDDMCALKTNLTHDKNEEKWAIDSGIDDTSVNTTAEKSVLSENKKLEDEKVRETNRFDATDEFLSNIESSVLPKPQKSPDYDFLAGETSPNIETKGITTESKSLMDDDTWNVIERPEMKKEIDNKEDTFKAQRDYYDEAPTKPLPPLPKNDNYEDDNIPMHTDYERERLHEETFEMSNDFLSSGGGGKTRGQQHSGTETGDSEFESAPEQSPAKTSGRSNNETSSYYTGRKVNADDIAPKEIFADMGLDAWFNPERLNPKVAALIYWRQPEKTGVVFGAILGVLLSLAYFSLISVFAYLSLLTLCGTVGFRVYKTFMQAVQKTSDGHPFKDILEVELTLPAEKVHGVADVAVAHANAAVAELRRLFLVEDFIDSLKFGVGLWCLTYVGSWFNGMTLIIIGVVALFTLPKVYETNKAQIDQNVALVHGKINELTAKVKAAIPLGKKSEPTKEE